MILVINSGSSSIKMALLDQASLSLHFSGIVEGLGSPHCVMKYQTANARETISLPGANHQHALESISLMLGSKFPSLGLSGIGHRVVHGGETFGGATLIDENVVHEIEKLSVFAPLHNPSHLLGIQAMRKSFPGIPQVAVFDTAFHRTMPPAAFRYAIPEQFYSDHKIRRYGAHGTSHQFVARRAAERLCRPINDLQLITAHLGNGCSACAIRNGRSVDTTMGLTPQEGMMMGTRSGDVDPTLQNHLVTITGETIESVTELLTKHSGLLGVSGSTSDCRELENRIIAGDEKAKFALELFCYRAAKSILGIAAGLSLIDALVFTGGIGENSSYVRQNIIGHLGVLQLVIDSEANEINGHESNGQISPDTVPAILIVKTDEELAIAQQTADVVGHLNSPPGPGKAPISRTDPDN